MKRSARPTRALTPIPLKALYTLAEIREATGLTRRRVMHLLRVCDVELLPAGRYLYVPLSEIRRKLEPLWREICEAQRILREEGG